MEKISVNDVITLDYTDKKRSEIINKMQTLNFDIIIIGS